MMERLQKVIAQAGICSRRKAEELILAGRVTLNGSPVTTLGTKADPDEDFIKVDGKRLRLRREKVYLLLNKPRGYLCTLSDPQGRPKVTDLIPRLPANVVPVGRLDYQTEGLLLLTNDGEFANCVARAGKHCAKTYLAKVRGNPDPQAVQALSHGILLEGQQLAPCLIKRVKEGDNPWFSVTLTQGRNNQVRKMFDRMGHPVLKLKRIQIGFLRDSQLQPGHYRKLTAQEVERFRRRIVSNRPDHVDF